jgi:hypothetical protein
VDDGQWSVVQCEKLVELGKDATMKLFEQSKPPYTVEKNENSTVITIASCRSIFHLAFYGFFILFWFYFLAGLGIGWGTLALFMAAPSKSANAVSTFMIVLFIFLSFLQLFHVYLSFRVLYLLLREWTGKEIIEINKTGFSVTLQVLDWRKSKTFAIQKIKNLQILNELRIFAFIPSARKWYEEKIAFDYDEKIYRFGFWLKEKEANEIHSIIQGLLDEMRNV